MLAELETGLVTLIRAAELGKRLRQVDSLPDLGGDSLIGRFATDSPAIYVAMGSFPVKNRYVRPKYGIACVAKNSRSHQAARHGDGHAIGLYEMLDAVMALLDGNEVSDGESLVSFEVTSCDLLASEALYQKGLYAAVVQIQAMAEVPLGGVTGDLADFEVFCPHYDIEPHQPSTEHAKWLREPPDLSASAPKLSDTLNLPQE